MHDDLADAIAAGAIRDARALGALLGHAQPAVVGSPVETLLAALDRVGRHAGFVTVPPRDLADDRIDVESIARASRLRIQRISLAGAWWQIDQGPLLGRLRDGDVPVALIPGRWGGYRMFDPRTGRVSPVDAALADAIAHEAASFHRTLPDQPVKLHQLLTFGLLRSVGDLMVLLAAGAGSAVLAMSIPWALAHVFSEVVPDGHAAMLVQVGLAMMLAVLAAFALECAAGMAQTRLVGRSAMQVHAALWDRLLRLPPSFAARLGAGDLAGRLATAQQLQEALLGIAHTVALRGQHLLVALATIWIVSPFAGLAALSLIVLLALAAATVVWGQKAAISHGEALQGNVFNQPVEYMGAIAKLRSSGAEERAFARWSANFIEMRRRSLQAAAWSNGYQAFCSAFEVLALAVLLVVLVNPWGGAPVRELGPTLVLLTAFATMLNAALPLSQTGAQVALILARGLRLKPLLDATPRPRHAGADPGKLTGALQLKGVSVRYEPGEPLALDDVSLDVRPGEFVAIVGPTGCGKSTLVRALLGLAPTVQGAVLFDGRELETLDLDAVRRQVGTVMQSGRLAPGTILDNIRGSTDASLDEAWAAARLAAADDDIRAMPMQMFTQVLDGVATFSGGQVQRILIARSLVGRPPIVLFDEATSALDAQRQAEVVTRVGALGCTRIVVAHRFSTIRDADRVVVMAGGRIVEQGSVDALLANGGYVAKMAAREGWTVVPEGAAGAMPDEDDEAAIDADDEAAIDAIIDGAGLSPGPAKTVRST